MSDGVRNDKMQSCTSSGKSVKLSDASESMIGSN